MAALAAGTAIAGTAPLQSAAATAAPAPTQLEGRLMVTHGVTAGGSTMVMQTELKTSSGVVPLLLAPSEHTHTLELAGQRVRVIRAPDAASPASPASPASFAVTSITPVATVAVASTRAVVAGATRSMRIAVVLLRLPGSSAEPVSKAAVQASTFGAANSVADWFARLPAGRSP